MRVRNVLTTLAMVAALFAGTVSPASAHPSECAGTGLITTFSPAGGNFQGSMGVCVPTLAPAYLAGHFSGIPCVLMTGEITIDGHHPSSLHIVGSQAVIGATYGEMKGSGTWSAAVGQSCLTGPTQYQVTLVLATIQRTAAG